MKLVVTVPWQYLCSDNRKYVALGVLSPQYRESKEAIALTAKVAAKKQRWKEALGPLKMTVCITEPDHRKRDHLNFAKGVCDALTLGGIWSDDSQVRDAHWYFSDTVDKANAGAVITVEVR
jgi:Holliday junction resolvase RusA-like endonuclease